MIKIYYPSNPNYTAAGSECYERLRKDIHNHTARGVFHSPSNCSIYAPLCRIGEGTIHNQINDVRKYSVNRERIIPSTILRESAEVEKSDKSVFVTDSPLGSASHKS